MIRIALYTYLNIRRDKYTIQQTINAGTKSRLCVLEIVLWS